MSERVFTDPRAAAEHIRQLMRGGAEVQGSRHAMSSLGVNPHHADRRMSEAESRVLSQQQDEVGGEIELTYVPTPSINPADPRTSGAGYDPLTQRMRIAWGDGGQDYVYEGITPQEWNSFQQADSPGKWINAIGNQKGYHAYYT